MIIKAYANYNWKVDYEDFGMIVLPILYESKRRESQVCLKITIKEIKQPKQRRAQCLK